MAPTVLVKGPYGFFFFSSDGGEPAHVHVRRDDKVAKFWLDPVRLERSGGFSRAEILEIRRIIEANREGLMESWSERPSPGRRGLQGKATDVADFG